MMRAFLLVLQAATSSVASPPVRDSAFGRLVAELSEPGGFFWSDNLVSNETSYLHPIGKLAELGVRGGAYIGVGPEQNFSYIAEIRPKVAYLIDIRRDNLLLHLFFKAAFELARNRLEFLCFVYGRSPPADIDAWTGLSLSDVLGYVDQPAADTAQVRMQERRLFERIHAIGVSLSPNDIATIERLHGEFVSAGLDLRFSTYGGRSWSIFPTTRQLYLASDLRGQQTSYLATEERFRVVQALQRSDRVIPVVGNLAGLKALRAIGREVSKLGEVVSLIYVSNVEFYLFRDGIFSRFAENVAALPRGNKSFLVRSYFDRQTGVPHPLAVPGHFSVQVLQALEHFVRTANGAAAAEYWDIVTAGSIPLGDSTTVPSERRPPPPSPRSDSGRSPTSGIHAAPARSPAVRARRPARRAA